MDLLLGDFTVLSTAWSRGGGDAAGAARTVRDFMAGALKIASNPIFTRTRNLKEKLEGDAGSNFGVYPLI